MKSWGGGGEGGLPNQLVWKISREKRLEFGIL